MKTSKLRNSTLSALVGDLNHEDITFVADIARQCPKDVQKIDMALMAGVPSFEQVIEAIASETVFQEVVFAKETLESEPDFQAILESYLNKGIKVTIVDHLELTSKYLSKAKALVRTGENKPYRNVALISGVAF